MAAQSTFSGKHYRTDGSYSIQSVNSDTDV